MHIAIIPDGNRRWAQKTGKPAWWGHMAGAKKMEEFADWCSKHPEVKTVSVYALSTENLNRSPEELDRLWGIYQKEFTAMMKNKAMKEKGLRVNVIGNNALWRSDVRQAARDVMRATRQYTGGVLNILLAYGSQFEMMRGMKKLVGKGIKNVPFAEDTFNKLLMVTQPVDLVIRTGGQSRLSNFLLYQAAYAELYFTDTLWPDFSRKEFEKILKWYAAQQRKFGK
jgi:undecaprenyl diphosphate synthase